MTKKDIHPQYLSRFPYYGRHGQDQYMNDMIFGNMKHGIFVDIGAYDGIESSNTLFFEETLGWYGICVEPLPQVFPRLTLNRKCICINTCALDCYNHLTFRHVIPNKTTKLNRKDRIPNVEKLSGLIDFACNKHQAMIDKMIGSFGGRIEYFKVDCVPINTILNRVNNPIDLLSIDTEGCELCILRAIDFSIFSINVIIVETLFSSVDISHFMKEKGYIFIKRVGYDSIYKKSTTS